MDIHTRIAQRLRELRDARGDLRDSKRDWRRDTRYQNYRAPFRYHSIMKWTLPNSLTVLRLLAAPGVAVMFLYFHRPYADWFALTLFVVAAITDYFDGYLARLWKQESKFGTMLDPIADKTMVVIALLIITGYSGMNPWLILPATVILFREVFVGGLREFLGKVKAQFPDVTNITLLCEEDTPYELMIYTMDAVRYRVEVINGIAIKKELFPEIGIGTAPADARLGGDV